MTSDQAAQMITQNDQILAFLRDLIPLVKITIHDVMPAVFVAFALWLGVMLGRSAT